MRVACQREFSRHLRIRCEKISGIYASLTRVKVTRLAPTHPAVQRSMTAPAAPWLPCTMTSMFIFTGGAVGVLLISFLVAEVRDATRGRRNR